MTIDSHEAVEDSAAPILYTFANRSPAPELEHLLAIFYQGAMDNQLGMMQALNTVTGEEELILVGVSIDQEGKPACFPLASLLSAEAVANYRAPDGKGGFFNLSDPEEAQVVKDSMKAVDEATVELQA